MALYATKSNAEQAVQKSVYFSGYAGPHLGLKFYLTDNSAVSLDGYTTFVGTVVDFNILNRNPSLQIAPSQDFKLTREIPFMATLSYSYTFFRGIKKKKFSAFVTDGKVGVGYTTLPVHPELDYFVTGFTIVAGFSVSLELSSH